MSSTPGCFLWSNVIGLRREIFFSHLLAALYLLNKNPCRQAPAMVFVCKKIKYGKALENVKMGKAPTIKRGAQKGHKYQTLVGEKWASFQRVFENQSNINQ